MAARLDDVRKIALGLPEVVEMDHFGRPSFRVRGRIFVTLWPKDGKAMVKLTPEQQDEWIERPGGIFEPVPGTWGAMGATMMRVEGKGGAGVKVIREAVQTAWGNAAPKSLRKEKEGKRGK